MSESGRMHLGDAPLHFELRKPRVSCIEQDGERWFRMQDADQLPPFLMSVVSGDDHWLYISSNGGLTAGRRDPDGALLPYTTDDRVHDSGGLSGPRTVLRVTREGRTYLWEPFSDHHPGVYDLRRALIKSEEGDRLEFEECNQDLGLTFRYRWGSGRRFGFQRTATLQNHGPGEARVELLDGLLNLLPAGVERGMQANYSTLLDAYKEARLMQPAGIGVFSLSSVPVDRAEPSEALRASSVWCQGLPGRQTLLCANQLEPFRRGEDIQPESSVRGQRLAYLVHATLDLASDSSQSWTLVAEVEQDAADLQALADSITGESDLTQQLLADQRANTQTLRRLVASADGLQRTASPFEDARHFANTLFNIMRGGVFADGYRIDAADLRRYVQHNAPLLAQRFAAAFESLPDFLSLSELRSLFQDEGLRRVVGEYLPLSFSRRHGDPSRPWNAFKIDLWDADGEPRLNYQGNWRDIFQNWEALGFSYPAFLESFVRRFLNASTADGYNPYRVTRDGFEWEELDPSDDWSYIGYWGDHQVIYLLRLLEAQAASDPGSLGTGLGRNEFAYADLPYRIASYAKQRANPQDTIDYDFEHAARLAERLGKRGQEGKLVPRSSGSPWPVTLAEKLVVPLLVKLTNLVPEAGIWLNTQRPEWNDANNALVGLGASVVTTAHLVRALSFTAQLLEGGALDVSLSSEVGQLARRVFGCLGEHAAALDSGLDGGLRVRVLSALGQAGSEHRATLYQDGFCGRRESWAAKELAQGLRLASRWAEHTLRANRREDGLYHGYNLLEFRGEESLDIRRLPLMLEGQVAALSAGCLSAEEACEVLRALRASDLFRADQHSYLLYPDRQRPALEQRGCLAVQDVEASPLLRSLLEAGDRRVVIRDRAGTHRFAPDLRNAEVLARVLDEIAQESVGSEVGAEREALLALYERVFDHAAFTGRSGSFYGYEGLGCIYWHQVSKLLLAVQEVLLVAQRERAPSAIVEELKQHYFDVRKGLGTHKSPALYGAFPTDPYSHTPGHAGAQQPGMTGQVKEDFLARMGELGVRVRDGCVSFDPMLVRSSEYLEQAAVFTYLDLAGTPCTQDLGAGSLAFTLCQTPVVLHRDGGPRLDVQRADGTRTTLEGLSLSAQDSASLFQREGSILRLDVAFG